MQKITPCLWFDGQAEEAVRFYAGVFKNSKIKTVAYYGKGMHRPEGSVLTILFELNGQEFLALNGGPEFKFSPAISFIVDCATQKEIDEHWRKLSKGGKPGVCGWLDDRYGVSWQIVPTALGELLTSGDAARTQRVLDALMKMTKLDLRLLKKAGGKPRRA